MRRILESAEPAMQPLLRLGARIGKPLAKLLNSRAKSLRWAGAELGLLAFLANSVMVGSVSAPLLHRAAKSLCGAFRLSNVCSRLDCLTRCAVEDPKLSHGSIDIEPMESVQHRGRGSAII